VAKFRYFPEEVQHKEISMTRFSLIKLCLACSLPSPWWSPRSADDKCPLLTKGDSPIAKACASRPRGSEEGHEGIRETAKAERHHLHLHNSTRT